MALLFIPQNEDMPSTVNRDYTSQERIGLGLLSQLVADAYSQIVPIAQTAVAGGTLIVNKFSEVFRTTFLGTAQEPSFLHEHIIGRGDPQKQYIEDVALDGPEPGLNFDMMAKTPSEPGNDKKVQWKEGEGDILKVANRLKFEIDKIKLAYEEYGLQVTIGKYWVFETNTKYVYPAIRTPYLNPRLDALFFSKLWK